MQLKLETRLVSSLEKVFAGQAPVAMAPSATMLRQDFLAFQLACRFENEGFSWACGPGWRWTLLCG